MRMFFNHDFIFMHVSCSSIRFGSGAFKGWVDAFGSFSCSSGWFCGVAAHIVLDRRFDGFCAAWVGNISCICCRTIIIYTNLNFTFTLWHKLQYPLTLRLPRTTFLLCPLWLVGWETFVFMFSFCFWGTKALLLLLLPLFLPILLFLIQALGRRWLMGTLGDKGEFYSLLCSCWQAARPRWVVIGLVVWRAAAGVWSERLGADTAVILCSGQQVKLWLWGLQTGEMLIFILFKWGTTCNSTYKTGMTGIYEETTGKTFQSIDRTWILRTYGGANVFTFKSPSCLLLTCNGKEFACQSLFHTHPCVTLYSVSLIRELVNQTVCIVVHTVCMLIDKQL